MNKFREITNVCTYQGAKTKYSKQIIDLIISQKTSSSFYDVCCGSGTISIEMVKRNFVQNKDIYMLDNSPWGTLWEMVGKGNFDLKEFGYWAGQVPSEQSKISSFLVDLSRQIPQQKDIVYIFLLLQSGAFGGKAIWINENSVWQNCTFRSHWLPTLTSKRRSPVIPMKPQISELLRRMDYITEIMFGINGLHIDIKSFDDYLPGSVIYVDPPYKNSTKYGYNLDVLQMKQFSREKDIYISESYPLPLYKNHLQLSQFCKKGGISGKRKKFHEEWLSWN